MEKYSRRYNNNNNTDDALVSEVLDPITKNGTIVNSKYVNLRNASGGLVGVIEEGTRVRIIEELSDDRLRVTIHNKNLDGIIPAKNCRRY